jgi:hypothetical protein
MLTLTAPLGKAEQSIENKVTTNFCNCTFSCWLAKFVDDSYCPSTRGAFDLKMADTKVYQASTTAPVNIAVVK